MTRTILAKNITLDELEKIYNLQLVEDNQFFREWQDDLPEIADWQQQLLDQVKAGYFNLIKKPPLLEKTINMAIVSPLLFIGQFYLQPFYLKTEESLEVFVEDEEVIIKGSLDTLVLKDQFWVMVIESKRASFSIEAGLAQILAYMLGNPNPERPSYGTIATGGTFIFIKLVKGVTSQYATSAEFSLRNPGNDLCKVLSILKRLSHLVLNQGKSQKEQQFQNCKSKIQNRMTITIPIHTIELTPGSTISIHNLSWQDFEQILAELGEKRNTRMAYYRGTLEIMSPLALHERPHRIIADIVKAILDAQERDWDDFGSTTFRRPEIAVVEPDTCLYIQNASLIRGCTDMDLDVYPPPDLAIESDLTSKTTLEAYQALCVPEVWIYRSRQLTIYILQNEEYVKSPISPIFPDLPIAELIPQLVQKAMDEGTSRMLRELKVQFG